MQKKGQGLIRLLLTTFILFLLTSVNTWGSSHRPPSPLHLSGGKIIDVYEARTLLQKGAAFFDVRSPLVYGQKHIKGAVSLSYKGNSACVEQFDSAGDAIDLTKLPVVRSEPLVFYTYSATGWKAYKAAMIAISNGYTEVYWLRDGFVSWLEMNFPVE